MNTYLIVGSIATILGCGAYLIKVEIDTSNAEREKARIEQAHREYFRYRQIPEPGIGLSTRGAVRKQKQ